MIKQTLQRGFTLIELLVVIAIIGILAAVVIGSLNDARSGGQNASAQQSIANARPQAELVYNSNNYSYTTVCSDTRVETLIQAALSAVGSSVTYTPAIHGIAAYQATNGAAASAKTASCKADDNRYMIVAPISTDSNDRFWCVDSTGASGQITGAPGSAIWQCP